MDRALLHPSLNSQILSSLKPPEASPLYLNVFVIALLTAMSEPPASGISLKPFARYSKEWKKWKLVEAPTVDLLGHMYLDTARKSAGVTVTRITLETAGFDAYNWCAWLAQVIADVLYAADGKVSHRL